MERCSGPKYAFSFLCCRAGEVNILAIIHFYCGILCSKIIPEFFFSSSQHLLSSLPQEESPHFNELYTLYDCPKPFLQNDAVKTPKCIFFISSHITERGGTQTSILSLRGANLVWNPLKRTAVRHGWMPQQKHLNHIFADGSVPETTL